MFFIILKSNEVWWICFWFFWSFGYWTTLKYPIKAHVCLLWTTLIALIPPWWLINFWHFNLLAYFIPACLSLLADCQGLSLPSHLWKSTYCLENFRTFVLSHNFWTCNIGGFKLTIKDSRVASNKCTYLKCCVTWFNSYYYYSIVSHSISNLQNWSWQGVQKCQFETPQACREMLGLSLPSHQRKLTLLFGEFQNICQFSQNSGPAIEGFQIDD